MKKLLQVRISTFLEKGPKFNKAYWMWIFPWIKLSWHICSMWDKLGWLIDSDNFSVRGYLTLVRKDSITHMHGLAVYLKERLSFAQDFRKLCRFLLMFLTSFTSLCLTSFSFIDHLLCLYARFLILFHLT